MKIEREDFIKALALVKPALASGGVVQELNHLWFDTKFVYAYDGGFGIKLPLKTDLECGVPGTPLINLLGTSALKEAELQQEKDKLLLKFGLLKSRGGMFAHTGTANEGSPAMRSDKAEAKPSPPRSRATESGGDADQLENSKDRTESRFQRRLHTIT